MDIPEHVKQRVIHLANEMEKWLNIARRHQLLGREFCSETARVIAQDRAHYAHYECHHWHLHNPERAA